MLRTCEIAEAEPAATGLQRFGDDRQQLVAEFELALGHLVDDVRAEAHVFVSQHVHGVVDVVDEALDRQVAAHREG